MTAQFDTQQYCGAKSERRGYNQATASGRPFWALDPRPEDINVYDIACGLSRECRFNGAIRDDIEVYSVAQHSVLVSDSLPVHLKLEGLFHDAPEAFIRDMIKPLKHAMPDWCIIEKRIDKVIRSKYGLPLRMTPEVKRADAIAVVTERRDILPENFNVDWGDDLPEPWPEKITAWLPSKAREEFMKRFLVLYKGVER